LEESEADDEDDDEGGTWETLQAHYQQYSRHVSKRHKGNIGSKAIPTLFSEASEPSEAGHIESGWTTTSGPASTAASQIESTENGEDEENWEEQLEPDSS
jgi:hypothetical protein